MTISPESLPTGYDELKTLCLSLLGDLDHANRDIAKLEEYIRLLRTGRFGSKSESMLHPGMQSLFASDDNAIDAVDEPAGVAINGHIRKPKGRQPFPDNIPREEIRLEVPEAERRCECCGSEEPLKLVSEQAREKLHVKPAQYVVLRYLRPVYSCTKCETMKAAAMPPHPIPRCSVTTETLSGIAVSKYLDSLPLYRQEQIFLRHGIDLGRDKMSRWMVMLGERLTPLTQLLHGMLLSGNQLNMDETSMQVLKEEDRLATSKGYMVVQARGDPGGRSIVLFHYSPSRCRESIGALLEGFQGNLLTDGLGVYDSFGKNSSGVVHAGCWAHSRRRFVEAQKGTKATSRKGSLAAYGLELIDQLFEIDRQGERLTPVERKALRDAKSISVLAELKKWLDERVVHVPKKSLIGEAIHYTLNQWDKLTRFLEDGNIPLHNNFVENMIRPFAVGRRNWLFSDTPEGAHANAVLYSLLVTAKVNGLNPSEYLTRALKGICTASTESELSELLPLQPIQ